MTFNFSLIDVSSHSACRMRLSTLRPFMSFDVYHASTMPCHAMHLKLQAVGIFCHLPTDIFSWPKKHPAQRHFCIPLAPVTFPKLKRYLPKLQSEFVAIVCIACASPQNPFPSQPLDTRTTRERSLNGLTGSPHRGCV